VANTGHVQLPGYRKRAQDCLSSFCALFDSIVIHNSLDKMLISSKTTYSVFVWLRHSLKTGKKCDCLGVVSRIEDSSAEQKKVKFVCHHSFLPPTYIFFLYHLRLFYFIHSFRREIVWILDFQVRSSRGLEWDVRSVMGHLMCLLCLLFSCLWILWSRQRMLWHSCLILR